MKEQEKENIYTQMTTILEQIQIQMRAYEDLKNYLLGIENRNSTDEKKIANKNKFALEVETQKYFSQKQFQSVDNSYQTIALKVSAILKEKGVPLSTRKIYELLLDDGVTSLSYSNLSKNILRQANNDSKINIERAFRGYWQYRQKNF